MGSRLDAVRHEAGLIRTHYRHAIRQVAEHAKKIKHDQVCRITSGHNPQRGPLCKQQMKRARFLMIYRKAHDVFSAEHYTHAISLGDAPESAKFNR
jgi:recombinational DNA repair protein RecR